MCETLLVIKRTRDYLDYIEEHVKNVQRAWEEVQEKCSKMRFVWDDYVFHSISQEVKYHDLSKLSAKEFVQYREFFYSAGEAPEKPSAEQKAAFQSHYASNDHHWQTWTEKEYSNPYSEEVHCVHMVLDWMAMSYKMGDTARDFYNSHKDEIKIPDCAKELICRIFDKVYGVEAQADKKEEV